MFEVRGETVWQLVRTEEHGSVWRPVGMARWLIDLLPKFVRAGEKQRLAMRDGFGHALHCNYQHPSCARCNCGVADLQTALRLYDESLPAVPVTATPLVEISDANNEWNKKALALARGETLGAQKDEPR